LIEKATYMAFCDVCKKVHIYSLPLLTDITGLAYIASNMSR